MAWITYAQNNGWKMQQDYYQALPMALHHGMEWGYAEASRDWPIGSLLRLCSKNQYYNGPPLASSTKLKRNQKRIDTSKLWQVQQVRYTTNFRSSRWISVRISNTAEDEDDNDILVWTNVVREPNVWRHPPRRRACHYTNWHTQRGMRQ